MTVSNNYNKKGRLRKILADLIIVSASFWFAALMYSLLYLKEDRITDGWLFPVFAIFIVITIACNFIFKQYDSIWKFFGFRDLIYMGISAVVSCVTIFLVTYFFAPYFKVIDSTATGFRCGFFGALASLITSIVTIASRVVYKEAYIFRNKDTGSEYRRLAIVGGGSACSALLSNINNMTNVKYLPICIFDDDVTKLGCRIEGVQIVGGTEKIPELCKEYKIDDILLAIPSADRQTINRIVDICIKTECQINITPNLADVKHNEKGNYWKEVRRVNVEDLMPRKTVRFNDDEILSYVKDKTILVTGGGGSIGSEICRQIALHKPKKLVIMDIYENTTYEVQQELLDKYHDELNLVVEIATMCDKTEVDNVFATHRPDIVFHAAAHKHVPLMETSVDEAIKNNIFGTYNVITAADKYGVKKFIQISTDKAVNPTNVMGATKRFCEMMVQSMKKRSQTEFAAVRFGNVLGSHGSVIPRFKKQIEEGGPVTVTHPDMTRYFMTIPEAVRLVLLAGYSAKSGNVYVLDMGKPVKISEFARKMIILSGYVPDKDIKIVYSGLRPGEKLYEELIIDDKRVDKTANDKVFIEKLPEIEQAEVEAGLEKFRSALEKNSRKELVKAMSEIVPTYTPDKRHEI